MPTILLFIIGIALFIWSIIIYNRLVTLKNQSEAAWSDISVQLKRRHDLIPKLVEVVQQYAHYEESVLSRITALRSEGQKISQVIHTDRGKAGQLEQSLEAHIKQIIVLAEDYPDLKASQHFIELQTELSHIEDTLQHARRFYNGAVRLFNTRIDSFPDLLIAKVFHYQAHAYFQLT